MSDGNKYKTLLAKWKAYSESSTKESMLAFVDEFCAVYKEFYDPDFNSLTEGFCHDSPYLSQHPQYLLEKLDQVFRASTTDLFSNFSTSNLRDVTSILKCLVIICRNHNNVTTVASHNFVSRSIACAQVCITQICNQGVQKVDPGYLSHVVSFVKLVLHFLECLYDPCFVWRKRLKGWTVDTEQLSSKPHTVHNEVVPFFHECFQMSRLSEDLQLCLLQMLGAVMSGSLKNSAAVVTPASMNVVMSVLSGKAVCCSSTQTELKVQIQRAVLELIVLMVHTVHLSNLDQWQVEVPEIMSSYMQVFSGMGNSGRDYEILLAMTDAIVKMTACRNRLSLQTQLAYDTVFEGLVAVVKKASGSQGQKLVLSVVRAVQALLSGSKHCKLMFEKCIGHKYFLEVLYDCGQPTQDLLQYLLNFVLEVESGGAKTAVIKNVHAMVNLMKWVGLIESPDLQLWLSQEIRRLCSYNYGNQVACCQGGMIGVLLSLLSQHSKLQPKTVGQIISTLEKLGSYSITSTELKELISLMRPDDDGKQFPFTTHLMRAISSMARRKELCGPLYSFDIQHMSDVINLPGIQKWSGPAFSFYCLLCLDKDFCPDSEEESASFSPYRRLLYSFSNSNGCGFEAFFTPNLNLTVATFSKKEFNSVTVADMTLNVGLWHSVCVVHMTGRRFPSSPGHVCIYIDGKLKTSVPLKFPSLVEPFTSCRVGSPGTRTHVDIISDNLLGRPPEVKKTSPIKSFFHFHSRSGDTSGCKPFVHTQEFGKHEETWGPVICLHGQLESICVFHDVLQPEQVKALSNMGPNSLFHFSDDPVIADLPAKLIARYSAKTYIDCVCTDLSPAQNHGIFSGNQCASWDIRDVINCLGGIQVLFPILENLDQSLQEAPDIESPSTPTTAEAEDLDLVDWALINNSTSQLSEMRLEHNQLASFITMLRYMLKEKPVNKDVFVRNHCAATLGMLMQKVHREMMDVSVLMSVQYLVEDCDDHLAVKSTLLQHIYHYILFDFSLWSKTQFAVRIGHIQYLSTVIKDDRKYFRKKYGVQFFLDVIRAYYINAETSCLTDEDSKTIRVSLLNLIKFYIINSIHAEELSQIMGFIVAVKEPVLLLEVLDLLISLLESRNRRQDQLILLLYEPDQAEMFYELLTYSHQPLIFYEKIVKILYLLLKTERVYEKSKSRLRLAEIGHWGLIHMMDPCTVSAPMIKYFMEQVSFTDIPQMFSAMLAVLGLVRNCGLDIKSVASKQLLTVIVSKSGAAKGFAKQLGWQENITHLLTLERRRTLTSSSDSSVLHKDSSNKMVIDGDTTHRSCDHYLPTTPSVNVNHPDETSNEDLLLDPDPSVVTPLYMKRAIYELGTMEEENPDENRSSTANIEGLGNNASSMGDSLRSTVSSTSCSSMAIEVGGALGSSQTSMEIIGNSPRSDFQQIDEFRRQSTDSTLDMDDSRRGSSVLISKSIEQVLDDIRVELNDSMEQKEELCQHVLIILLTIMWKGVEGSSSEVWKERYQVFTWIDELGNSYELIRPVEEIKRRLIEMMLHSCTTDICSSSGQTIAAETENAIKLIQLVQAFLTELGAPSSRFSSRLLEDVMSLLDALGVWDTEVMVSWTEMVHRGFSVLLAFCKQPDLGLVSLSTVKMHSLIQTKFISSSAEASYILGALNSLIVHAIDVNSDSYAYLMPILKALIDKGQEFLNISTQLPHLPSTSTSPTFYDDFKTYAYSDEWQQFISNYIGPQMTHVMESSFKEGTGSLSDFWSSCHEEMMMNHHKHYREIGESKLKFKKQIEEVFRKKVELENRRFVNNMIQQKNQLLFALRQWRATKRFFTGERGAWRNKEQKVYWKLSSQENFARMKLKLTQNYKFDDHIMASRLRDNMGVSDTNNSLKFEELKRMKEALVSRENIADDTLGDEEWSAISSSNTNQEEYSGKEKLVISADCELITVADEVRGKLEVTTTHVYFFDCNPKKEEAGEDFKWALSRLREIHFRRYNLRRSALEVFLIDQTNYFINFPDKSLRNKIYSRILSLRPTNLIYKGQRSPGDLLRASGLTQKWIHREISNFEYLMQLNTIAGRSYNDLSQYPVFPWILVDYTSKDLDLENPKVFRDLSKPIGVVNPKNEEEVRDKYETFEDPTGMIEKFHYGTHYSNAASVMHYLVRVEPFTTLHIQLQSDKFDVADRQFHNIPGSFYSLMDNPNDVKELIPEFFYFPEFLVNFNGFDLGKLQVTRQPVNDVKLPAWASTPEEFIYKHRQALESEHVSMNLHNWIDLIFGYKQKGPAAVEALNVFYYVTYEGAVDLDAIKDPKERASIEGMIRNFGQTPSQLLREPHPKRLTFTDVVARNAKSGKPMSIFNFIHSLKPFFVEISSDRDPLVFVNVPKSQSRSILQQGMPDSLVTLTEDGVIGVHGWLPFDKAIPNFYTFDKDATMSNSKTRKRMEGPFFPGVRVTPKLFVVSHDAKLLFSGGYWDNSIQVYSLSRPKMISHIVRHIDVVTCLALDNCGRHLVSGSRDTTCMVWEITQQAGVSVNLNPKPLQTLYGHDSEITAVHISTELDLVVSASKDGTVILHTVLKGYYTRTLRIPVNDGWLLDIPNMVVSDMGQIIVYCVEVEKQSGEEGKRIQERLSLHLYSVNGKHLFNQPLQHSLNDLCVAGDHLILGNSSGQLIIMEIFGLRPITTMELLVPIQCLALSNINTHILAGLRDGKLIIVGHRGK